MRVAPPRPPVPAAFIFACIALFAVLSSWIVMVPTTFVERVESPPQAWVLSMGSPSLDRIMVGLTMLGDFPLTVSLMSGVIVLLLLARRHWLAIHATAVFLSVKLAVGIVKALTERVRPLELYPGGDVFSFPSGHAASATLLLGVYGCLICSRWPPAGRVGSSTACSLITAHLLVLAVLVALSRVYLQAHWPSDVIAGVALASALIAAFRWQVDNASPLPGWLPTATAVWLAAGYAGYLVWQFNTEFDRYRHAGAFLGRLVD